MDYSITIAGTVEDDEEVLELAQEFVGGLEGVTLASFNSPNFANVDLTEEDDVEVGDESTATEGNGES